MHRVNRLRPGTTTLLRANSALFVRIIHWFRELEGDRGLRRDHLAVGPEGLTREGRIDQSAEPNVGQIPKVLRRRPLSQNRGGSRLVRNTPQDLIG